MRPRLVTLPPFHAVGLSGRFTPATVGEIPALWCRFVGRLPSIPGRRDDVTYGLCYESGAVDRSFEYVAAVEVGDLAAVPAGLVGKSIPAGTYAVFTHEGHISRIGTTFDAIRQRWLPASGLTRLAGPDFERYDERWDPATGEGPVDIYVPVNASRA